MPVLQSSPRSCTAQEKESLSRVAKEFNDMVRRTVSISADAQKMALRLPLITFQKEITETSQKVAKLFSNSTFESIQKIADLQKHQATLMTNMLKPPRFDFGQSEIKSIGNAMEVNLQLAKLSERSFLQQKLFTPNLFSDSTNSLIETEYEIGQVEEYDTNQLAIGATLFQIGIKLLSEPRQSPQATSDNIANLSLLPTSEFRYGTRTLNSITTASREGRLLKLLLTSPHNHATKEIIDNEFKDHRTDIYKLREYIIKALNKENINIGIKSLRTNGYILESISPIH